MNKFSIKEMLSLSFTESVSYIDKLREHFKQAEAYQRQNGLSDFTNLSQFEKQTQEIVQQFVKALEKHPNPSITLAEFEDIYQKYPRENDNFKLAFDYLLKTLEGEELNELVREYGKYARNVNLNNVGFIKSLNPTALTYLFYHALHCDCVHSSYNVRREHKADRIIDNAYRYTSTAFAHCLMAVREVYGDHNKFKLCKKDLMMGVAMVLFADNRRLLKEVNKENADILKWFTYTLSEDFTAYDKQAKINNTYPSVDINGFLEVYQVECMSKAELETYILEKAQHIIANSTNFINAEYRLKDLLANHTHLTPKVKKLFNESVVKYFTEIDTNSYLSRDFDSRLKDTFLDKKAVKKGIEIYMDKVIRSFADFDLSHLLSEKATEEERLPLANFIKDNSYSIFFNSSILKGLIEDFDIKLSKSAEFLKISNLKNQVEFLEKMKAIKSQVEFLDKMDEEAEKEEQRQALKEREKERNALRKEFTAFKNELLSSVDCSF